MKLDTRRGMESGYLPAGVGGFPEGQQVTVRALFEISEQRQVLYTDELGYYVNQQRFEVYTQTYDDPGLHSAANLVEKIREILPHTPLGNFGINFRFLEGSF